jgi:hypothetical protein
VTIGLDLDNTIVCYDKSLHRLAVEGFGMPATVLAEKNAVRQYFRDQARERDWTTLQGIAYGLRMSLAKPFPGALEFVQQAIGSHRSQNCFMRESQVCLDHEGNFSVCCVQSPSAPSIANYLDTPYKVMQTQRYASDLCRKCTSSGINIFATYGMQEPPEIQQSIEDLLPVDLKDFR